MTLVHKTTGLGYVRPDSMEKAIRAGDISRQALESRKDKRMVSLQQATEAGCNQVKNASRSGGQCIDPALLTGVPSIDEGHAQLIATTDSPFAAWTASK